jgi:hypothetical protein
MGTVKSEQAKNSNVERKMTKKIITYGAETAYRSLAGGGGFESRQGEWIFVSYECGVSSGRCLCDRPITILEEFYQMWCALTVT